MLNNGKKIFIKSLLVFVLVLFIIYIFVGSNIHNIFVKNYLLESKQVFYLGKEYSSGILDWQILRNHIIIAMFSVFTITFAINNVVFQRESKSFPNQITQRIINLRKGVRVEDNIELIVIDREIQELIKNEDELREKIKSQFINYNQEMMFLAHDLKTPLTAIIGYINLLIDNPNLDDDAKKKYLRIAMDSSYQLESLIDKFFELSKYSVQADISKKQRVKLEDIIIEIQESLYINIKKAGITFENDSLEKVYINVNPELFARALINIYRNAVKYADKDSRIYTKILISEKEEVSILISNQSSGIDEINTNKMFNTFYRGANSLDGSGLGLPIAKAIIEKQGGEINAIKEENMLTISIKL